MSQVNWLVPPQLPFGSMLIATLVATGAAEAELVAVALTLVDAAADDETMVEVAAGVPVHTPNNS